LRKPARRAQGRRRMAAKPPKSSAKPLDRQARLAAALRENLRRRKAQERARADVVEPSREDVSKPKRIG
jgi:hypothetical protein